MKVILLLVILIAFLTIAGFGSEPIKEFGPSVTFDAEDPAIDIKNLKGKVVVIVFYQSWCPTCNKWSGEKFKKVEEAFSKDRSVVLVALKTDGGGVSGAKAYLKERANLENWIVGTDKNAEYYIDVNGKEELFHYAIVNGKGDLVEKGYFGSDALSKKNFSKGYFTKTFFKADAKYSDKLSSVVKYAELGFYKEALLNCRKSGKIKDLSEDAKNLEKDIFARLKDNIDDFSELLKNESDPDRFSNYLALRHLTESLHGMTIQNEAVKVLNEYKSEPFFKKELSAETAYIAYKKNLDIIKKSEVTKYKESFLPKFLETYKDTYYGALVEKGENSKK